MPRNFPNRVAGPLVIWLAFLLAILLPEPAHASGEFSPSSVAKGVLLVASPSLGDPNFREAVVLILEHGPDGTMGVIVNRSTKLLLSDLLPDVAALKGTGYRLFAGGPVQRTRLLMLFRLMEPAAGMQSVFDGVYAGGSAELLERVIRQPNPTEAFRAYAGYAGWGPRQLEREMRQGAWAVLPPDASSLFDADPTLVWPDSIARLQTPRVISE
ncbi:MAG TPA: YqgE/AlgH family protein [Nitrospira sp.]|nr:YqgE/AlgH family protein [Nitrospira sp.]